MSRKIRYAAVSEKGKRPNNQDAVLAAVAGDIAIMVVADGMGGHSFGERASGEIIKGLDECWHYIYKNRVSVQKEDAYTMCRDVLHRVNKELYEEYAEKGIVSGSTVVLLFIWGDEYVVMSVGDSHIYHIADGSLCAMTTDDVWENTQEVILTMDEKQRREDPRRGKLTAAVGPYRKMLIHEKRGKLGIKEQFLLCSDGIYRYIKEKDLEKLLKNFWLSEKRIVKILVRKALKNKTSDNYSAVLCRYKKRKTDTGKSRKERSLRGTSSKKQS